MCGLASGVILASASAYTGKGDLNDDGSIDYTDVELLQSHLIALELLPEEDQDKADMNFDRNLTVTDLSILIRRIEKNINYEISLSSAMDKFYYEKQEETELKFYAHISCGIQEPCQAVIETVTVNGREYEADRHEEGSLYTVKTGAQDGAGVRMHRSQHHGAGSWQM